MSTDYNDLLLQAGLLPSEAKMYLTALETGSTTAQNLAREAGISRTAAYDAIKALMDRGLMSEAMVGKRKVFVAEDPARLVNYVQSQADRFKTVIDDIKRAIPALKLVGGGLRPTVRMYEGEEALHAFFSHITETKPKTFDEITNLADVREHLDPSALAAARKSYKWTAKEARLLHIGDVQNPRTGVQFRSLPDTWKDFHGNIAIYDNYISLVTYIGSPTFVLIESEQLVKAVGLMYNALWESCPESAIPKNDD